MSGSLAQPPLQARNGFWGRPLGEAGGAQGPQQLFSRDLVGSGYTETYTATNGSQVTEQLQRQVWAAGGPP